MLLSFDLKTTGHLMQKHAGNNFVHFFVINLECRKMLIKRRHLKLA